MKHKKSLLFGLSAVILVTMSGCFEKQNALHESMVVCPENTQLISDDFEGKPVCQLRGTYTEDLHLTVDKFWALKGEVHIGIDGTQKSVLEVDPGTTVFGKTGADFLVVTRGSKIIAEGSAKAPILFTSMKDAAGLLSVAGDWGGIAIAGYAPTNVGKEERFEFSNTDVRFGGTDPEDNSGVLKYVQVRYAGNEVRPGEELNGLSFGGVGRGTTVDYVEVYHGKDDGIEAWGGNVNMNHIVLIGNGDDNLDFDHGYQGYVQYVYIEQGEVASIHARGIETDNNKKHPNALPRTMAKVSNFEIVGSPTGSEGVYSRRGSGLELNNGFIHNMGGVGIYVKSEGPQRFANNKFNAVQVASCKKGSVTDKVGRIHDLNHFNHRYSASVSTHNPAVAKLDQSIYGYGDFMGAYETGSDWRKGWSLLD